MRTVIGTTPQALERRGLALDRLAVLTLRRDAYAATPGAELPIWLGERTQYRAASAIIDVFDRPNGALGAGYTPWIASDAGGLVLQSGQVVPGVVNTADHVALYTTRLPRDQWGEVTIRTLTQTDAGAGYAAVGIGLRFVADTGYLATAYQSAGTRRAALRRVNAGVPTVLLDVAMPWQLGDVLRLTAEWTRLRLFRNHTCIGDVVDASPLLVAGQAAIQAKRAVTSDAAALDHFAAGALRQEYLGMLADLGDVSASLGFVDPTASPAAWAMSVINLAPVDSAARLSFAWRHGSHDSVDTYDLHRAPVRLAQAVQGGSVSIGVADGRVDHPEALTEGLVRLVCAGRDAFLMPQIEAGAVQYLPGPDPVSTTAPVPEDPCGADAPPTIDPGSVPAEPEIAADTAPVADGPEASAPVESASEEGGDGSGGPSLAGGWAVHLILRRGHGTEPEWVSETHIYELPDPAIQWPEFSRANDQIGGPLIDGRLFTSWRPRCPTDPTGSYPHSELPHGTRRMVLYYFGPDILGTHLRPTPNPALIGAPGHWTAGVKITGFIQLVAQGYYTAGQYPAGAPYWFPTPADSTTAVARVKLTRYNGAGIQTEADLTALRLLPPTESGDYLGGLTPLRIETLADMTFSSNNGNAEYPTYIGQSYLPTGAADFIPVHVVAGPCLIGLEIIDADTHGIRDGFDDEMNVGLYALHANTSVHGPSLDLP